MSSFRKGRAGPAKDDVEEKTGFIADGPVGIAFDCRGANIGLGGFMTGNGMGLLSWARNPGPILDFDQAGVLATSRDGPGVVGSTSTSHGVLGQFGAGAVFAPPAGVCGASQQGIGVVGLSSEQAAVVGQSNNGIGVHASSDESWGVVARSGAIAPVAFDAAIFGTSSKNVAVAAASGTPVAVRAHSGPPHNFGFFRTGAVTATQSGNGIGVSALSLKFDGVRGASFGSRGVTGLSSADHGVSGLSFAPPRAPGVALADAPAGVRGQSMNGSIGVLGVATPNFSSGAGVVGVGSPHAPAGYFEGDLLVTGQIFAGIKDATVPFPDGSKRLLHCMESPEHWFEDFGSARLTRGHVTVKLDADFASVVKLNEYRVFLTPEGDCQGLYVRKRGTSFEVRELQGGTSSVAFSYRIVAKRKDIKRHTRFAKIDTTVLMPTGKARAGRGRKAARLPSPTSALLAATALPGPIGRVRAARGRKTARFSIRKLLAATAIPMPTGKARAARGRKTARFSIRKLLAARETRRKPAVGR